MNECRFLGLGRRTGRSRLLFAALAIVLTRQGTATGVQLTYSKGQNVSPAFEGWEQAADGSRYFIFGYMNRNWEEEFDRRSVVPASTVLLNLIPDLPERQQGMFDLETKMRPGSVLVDIAIDQGGCFETSRPTSHSEPRVAARARA